MYIIIIIMWDYVHFGRGKLGLTAVGLETETQNKQNDGCDCC